VSPWMGVAPQFVGLVTGSTQLPLQRACAGKQVWTQWPTPPTGVHVKPGWQTAPPLPPVVPHPVVAPQKLGSVVGSMHVCVPPTPPTVQSTSPAWQDSVQTGGAPAQIQPGPKPSAVLVQSLPTGLQLPTWAPQNCRLVVGSMQASEGPVPQRAWFGAQVSWQLPFEQT
jgi:hypothetical protein